MHGTCPAQLPGRTGETDVLLYDAYDPRLGFCAPSTPSSVPLSLGSALFGDRLHPSLFQLHMLRNTTCRLLCRTTLSPKQQRFTTDLVWSAYSHNWLVDGLPVAQRIAARAWARNGTEQEVYYEPGFPVGLPSVRHSPLLAGALEEDGDGGVKADELARLVLLNNHFTLVLEYHRPRGKEDVYRVVGATVAPRSVDSLGAGAGGGAEAPDCAATQGALELEADRAESREVAYTYDVVWKESPISWATRWDIYLDFQHPRIHLLSLINSLFICVFLILMVSVILLRVLNRDITRYNALASYDLDLDPDADGGLSGGGGGGVQEDYGWKLLHGEIFRPPKQRMWLCITVGTGAQMAAMCLVTLFFALLGFLSPSNRGALATVMLVCWTLFGSIAGYVSSRLYLTLNGDAIRKNIIYTAMVFPSVLFAFLHLLNLFLIGVGSAGAVPFGTFAAIVLLWFGINVPLTIVGGWVGVKKGPLAAPSRVNSIPRQIPPVEWWVRPVPAALLAGILPFGAGFIELYYILQSIFGAKAYYAFGFLALSTGVVALTTALTSVLMCYFHLCAEDYRWHWRAFLTGASSGLYLFLYGLLFWASRLHLSGFANKVLYLGYLALLAALEGIVMGSVGFAACWVFVRVI
ncbi:Transmembrane 9 super member 2 [Rhodosporidiobolus nylandii]